MNINVINEKATNNKNNTQVSQISDRELLRVVKEEKRFPIPLSKRVKLSYLVMFYNKYWNNEFTDESDTDS